MLDVLRMLAGPLVLSSANRSGQPERCTAKQVLEALGDDIDLVLDDGPCRFGQPSSVVRVSGNQYDLLRAGVVPDKTLEASVQPDGVVRVHRQHLPQPDGRGLWQAAPGPAAALRHRRAGRPRSDRGLGRGRGDDGRPRQPGVGARDGRAWDWTWRTTKRSR